MNLSGWEAKKTHIAFIDKDGRLIVHLTARCGIVLNRKLKLFNIIAGKWKSVRPVENACIAMSDTGELWTLKDSFMIDGINENTFRKIDMTKPGATRRY